MPQVSTDPLGFTWFNTIGGALILCPTSDLPDWQGVDDARYDLASEEERPWISTLPARENSPIHSLLSLWVEPTSACWQPAPHQNAPQETEFVSGLLWRWVQGNRVYAELSHVLPAAAKEIEPLIPIEHPHREYLLFDSVDTGQDGLSTGVTLQLEHPLVAIRTFEFHPDPKTQFVVHQLLSRA